MAVATERFTEQRLNRSIDGNWTATRAWDVIGFTSEDDAVDATGVDTGSPHPRNADLLCTKIGLAENKLTLGKVVATYEITSLVQNPENPVNRPPVIDWKPGKNSEQIDMDQLGNPILNSALDAFKSHATRNYSTDFLTITRYEPFYNKATNDAYRDTVNNDTVLFEALTYTAGQMYFISYSPVEPYQEGSTYVKVAYRFEIRTPQSASLTALQKRHPFQLRILDQGLRCQYSYTPATPPGAPAVHKVFGQLYLKGGEPVTRDVLLDGGGKPLDPTIKVTQGMIAADATTLPSGVLKDVTANAVFLIYMRYAEMPFNSIGLTP